MKSSVFLAEAIGTFVFVLAILSIACRSEKDALPAYIVPALIGVGLLVAIYIGTGLGANAHLNPAVSIVMGLNGKISAGDILPHIAAQLVGAGGAFYLFKAVCQ